MVASYMDMLARDSSATYRQLLEDVAMHPAMGACPSHRSNRKEDTTGRVPVRKFCPQASHAAVSIGLYELNPDGSLRLNNGQPIETYSANDVRGPAGIHWLQQAWPSTKSAFNLVEMLLANA